MNPKLRQKLLEEWRGLPQPAEVPERTTLIGPVLEAWLAKLGLADRLDEQAVLACWKEVVGDFLASHSTPVGLKNGALLVRVSQPSVHYELDRSWKPRILATLRERFGAQRIREIRFQL
jgi:predicted nucleic acid-binding Zn ribbon protein